MLRPRSLDYLTIAGVDDVRAAWVNPAGLARVLEASVMAELVADRLPETRLAQYTVGLNSRGLSVSFAKDRAIDALPLNLTRLALGLPLGRGSLGGGVTLYRGSSRDHGIDLGLTYRPTGTLDVAATLRHVGRPVVRGVRHPVTGVLGTSWRILPTAVTLEGEVLADESGRGWLEDVRYRGMFRLSVPRGRARMELLAGVETIGRHLERLVVGFGVGTGGWLGAVGGSARGSGLDRPDRFSVTGVMSHQLAGRIR
ncbi:MAG TPA: hypothetical protein VD793_01315 [Gemmatimonadales bacterium]|nr:hypothetical protein [Gemmatimonadales bacterium]